MWEEIPALGSAAFKAGHIIALHSFSDNEQAGRGYFNFADMFVFRAVHASWRVEWPFFILEPQVIAEVFRSLIKAFLLPSGAMKIPSIF